MRNSLSVSHLQTQFARFQRLIRANDKGNPFTSFTEGVAGAWENYKPRLRQHALRVLDATAWSERSIGSGAILQHTIDAIEINDSRLNLINNLVFWQNRFGHANRDHRSLLEAVSDPGLRRDLETLLFGLYRETGDEAAIFRALRHLGIGLVTLRNCSWENYQEFNAALAEIREALVSAAKVSNVRLIDAHSFCWLLERMEEEPDQTTQSGRSGPGRIFGPRERSIYMMRTAVENTVRYSNGQVVERVIRNNELRMTSDQLEKLLASLLDLYENHCALTGIPFHFDGPQADRNLLPSVDRINSDGHYEEKNIQVVCRFINLWKRRQR